MCIYNNFMIVHMKRRLPCANKKLMCLYVCVCVWGCIKASDHMYKETEREVERIKSVNAIERRKMKTNHVV